MQRLQRLPAEDFSNISMYGNDLALALITRHFPQIKTLSKQKILKALLVYELIGWSGFIPDQIENLQLHIPIGYAKYL